jgi:dihydroorotase-like cyclic amidohydrolase
MRISFLLLPFLLCLICLQGHSQEKPILIVNGIVINGLGDQALKGWDMLIKDGKITKIEKHIKAPKGARIIYASGKTILPGLIDMHAHLYVLGKRQTAAYPLLYSAGGVTTLFSPGEFEPHITLALKKAIQQGEQIGADIFPCPDSWPC